MFILKKVQTMTSNIIPASMKQVNIFATIVNSIII